MTTRRGFLGLAGAAIAAFGAGVAAVFKGGWIESAELELGKDSLAYLESRSRTQFKHTLYLQMDLDGNVRKGFLVDARPG